MTAYLSLADMLGVALWALCWTGYQSFSYWHGRTHVNMLSTLRIYRRAWLRNALERENRVSDAALLNSLMQSASFFSSTTLFIMGGLLAFLGTTEKGLELVMSIPFAAKQSAQLIETKALILLLVFVHAFLRFTWSMRQFNVLCIFVGAFPNHPERMQDVNAVKLANRAGHLAAFAGEHFSQGVRSFYYALPVMLWFVNPYSLMIASVAITVTVYYMEFRSSTARVLDAHQSLTDQHGETVTHVG